MSVLKVADRIFPLSSDGRLLGLSEWTMEVAEALAEVDSLNLTNQHWEVIDFLRAYYRKFGSVPAAKVLKQGLTQRFGPAKATQQYLSQLFAGGVLIQGTKIAGIPAPPAEGEPGCADCLAQDMEEEYDGYCPWQFESETKIAG
ncbi:MAG: TusE/DsrC/DsvC family sulfur relay protein [Gammaproteobacteria bacterium]